MKMGNYISLVFPLAMSGLIGLDKEENGTDDGDAVSGPIELNCLDGIILIKQICLMQNFSVPMVWF